MSQSQFTMRSITGKVVKKELKRGIVNAILTKEGMELVLRQEGKTAMASPALDAMVGKTITATGGVQSFVLIVHHFKEENEA
jgi:hypothetical protein